MSRLRCEHQKGNTGAMFWGYLMEGKPNTTVFGVSPKKRRHHIGKPDFPSVTPVGFWTANVKVEGVTAMTGPKQIDL